MSKNQEFDQKLRKFGNQVLAFPFDDGNFYACWLAQTYAYVYQSVRMLVMAGGYFPAGDEEFRRRFCMHAREEGGHEQLAVRDLKALGRELGEFPVFPATRAFYETQYYRIQNSDPSSFFGWIVALEGLAVVAGPELHAKAAAAHGERACSFLKVHSSEDPEHLRKALECVTKLDGAQDRLVRENLELSTYLYGEMLNQCLQASCAKTAA